MKNTKYTKKQIMETIKHWQKKLDEDISDDVCACHININSAYNSGDEQWLYVAYTEAALASNLFPDTDGTLKYKDLTAELHSRQLVDVIRAMRADSLSGRSAVVASLTTDEFDGEDVEFNFYATDAIRTDHIVICD